MGTMNKLLNWIGISEEVDEEEEFLTNEKPEVDEPMIPVGKRGKVVNLQATTQMTKPRRTTPQADPRRWL